MKRLLLLLVSLAAVSFAHAEIEGYLLSKTVVHIKAVSDSPMFSGMGGSYGVMRTGGRKAYDRYYMTLHAYRAFIYVEVSEGTFRRYLWGRVILIDPISLTIVRPIKPENQEAYWQVAEEMVDKRPALHYETQP